MSGNLPERPATQRASDHDREDVVERLREAVAEGRLTMDEFEERMTSAYQARTFGELVHLTDDLPENTVTRSHPQQPAEVHLHATGSSLRRSGRWTVPKRVIVDGNLGSSVLDLTEATLLSPEVEVAANVTAGSLVIIVPPGTHADIDGLRTSFGSSHVRVDDPPDPRLRVRVTGTANMGSVTVRHLNVFERWGRQLRNWWRRRSDG